MNVMETLALLWETDIDPDPWSTTFAFGGKCFICTGLRSPNFGNICITYAAFVIIALI